MDGCARKLGCLRLLRCDRRPGLQADLPCAAGADPRGPSGYADHRHGSLWLDAGQAARTGARQPRAQWRRRCRRVCETVGAAKVRLRRLPGSGHLRAPAPGAGHGGTPAALSRHPPEHVCDRGAGPGEDGLRYRRARHRRKALRPRPCLGAGARPYTARSIPRVGGVPHRPLSGQGGGAESALFSLCQRVSRAGVEPQFRRQCPDHHGRKVRRAGPRQLLRGGRRDPRRCPEPSAAGDRVVGDEPGVAPDSQVETFVALCLRIDTWRWAGVPFYIRTGKCLPITTTEVIVDLKCPPVAIFDEINPAQSNYFRFRLSPEVVISAGARVKRPGEEMVGDAVELVARHSNAGEKSPYERLLGDAIRGDVSLFTRDDVVEAAWRVVNPILHSAVPVAEYEPGTWGPAAARAVVAGDEGWHDPKPEETAPC